MTSEPVKPKKKVYVPKPVQIVRTATDLQRIKLQKLMEHPERVVVIPEPQKDKSLAPPPEFNRNVMGSSAGAGSGEFHVYRHLRRREYARQKMISESADKETKDEEYHRKLMENKEKADDRTAKKRKKRLRKKLMTKLKKFRTNAGSEKSTKSTDNKDKESVESSDEIDNKNSNTEEDSE